MRTLTLALTAIALFGCNNDDELRRQNEELRAQVARLQQARSVVPSTPQAVGTQFPIWKTVQLGMHKGIADLRKALAQGEFRGGSCGQNMLARMPLPGKTTINLVRVAVSQLGFPSGATTAEIYARARERGLELCPAEVGPALRLAYRDQPKGEWLMIGMEPIASPAGNPSVFEVGRNGDGLWLDDDWARSDSGWNPADVFVFRLTASGASSGK